MSKINKHLLFFFFLVFIFIFAISVWYSPVLFKGYPSQPVGYGVLLARNYSQSGSLAMENGLNVFLASSQIKENANITTVGNKLTHLVYGLIYKVLGSLNLNQLVILSAAIHALALLFFTILIFYLFGWHIALIFPFIYILFPFQWQYATYITQYEIALLFFSLFCLFYFWGRNNKFKAVFLILAGIFLALTVMSREVFMMFIPVFFIYLIYKKKKFELITVFIPLVIIVLIFWLPSFFGQGNVYFYVFKTDTAHELQAPPFNYYSHLYPDPYTFHFAKQEFDKELNRQITSSDYDLAHVVGRIKVAANMGERKISIGERLLVGSNNFLRHLSRFFAIEVIGGPLIALLLVLGIYRLKVKNLELAQFFVFWIITVLLLFSYAGLVIRNHLIDFSWVLAALVALGLGAIFYVLKDYFELKKMLWPAYVFVILATCYNLVVSSHVFWGRDYDNKNNLIAMDLAEKIKQIEISDEQVIATSHKGGYVIYNYIADKSVIYFAPQTIDKLIAENKLEEAFEKFGVEYIVGFDDEQSKKITENTSVINIASKPKPEDVEPPVTTYTNKMWFLNLVR